MRTLLRITLAVATMGVLGGCALGGKTPTQKEMAIKHWNDERSAVLIALARDQFKNASFDKARQTIDEAIKLSPDIAAARVLSAKIYIETGELEAAEHELIAARKLDPANAESEYLSGIVYQRWQLPDKALEYYEHACEKAPAELAYLLAKSEMLVALDRRVEALAALQAKVEYFEHSGVIRDEVGLLLMQEKRYDEAIEMFRRAIILSPDEAQIREHMADAMFYDKRYSDCCETLVALLAKPPFDSRGDLWQMLGECQMQISRPMDAVNSVQKATELSPDSADTWLSLAKAEMMIDSLRQVDVAVHKALALEPANSETYLMLGYLRLKQTRLQDALQAFSRASQLAPTDTVNLCMLGYALEKLGRNEEALACYQQALKLSPKDEMATQLMARLDLHE